MLMVARSIPAEAALIYTMHEALRGYQSLGWGCDQSTPLSVSDAIVAGCGLLQLGVPRWAISVDYCK